MPNAHANGKLPLVVLHLSPKFIFYKMLSLTHLSVALPLPSLLLNKHPNLFFKVERRTYMRRMLLPSAWGFT